MGRDGRPLVVRRIAAFLGGLPGVPPGSHLLVACSGGPDSTALVAGLAECAAVHPMRLTLVHLRHGLRGLEDEDRDEAFVRQLADRLGVDVLVQSLGVIHGPNLEARARSARRAIVPSNACCATCARRVRCACSQSSNSGVASASKSCRSSPW